MKNYKSLKEYYENAKDNIHDVEKDIMEFKDIDDFELYIKSIMRSKARTLIMITHIDSTRQVLEEKLSKNDEVYKFKVIKSIYIDEKPMTFEELAENYSCNPRTIRRWFNEIIRELSILLFGIGALDDIA